MFIQSLSGGSNGYYGYGFGAAGLVQGKDFNCNAAICYAIGAANDKLFKQLQQAINTLSKAGGFTPLVVDGFIGDKTVIALKALTKLGLESAPATKEQAASQAPSLLPVLIGIATATASRGQALAPPGAQVTYQPTTHTTTALPTPTVISTQMPSTAAALPKPKSKMLWWILGGLAVAATVGGVGYVVYRRKAA